jgi:hypothetical protein
MWALIRTFRKLKIAWRRLSCGHKRTVNNKIPAKARAHYARVKALPCSVCDAPGPSDAHHIKQNQHYTIVALCKECHQGPMMGWHGQKRMWAIKKMDEMDALAVTIERLEDERHI